MIKASELFTNKEDRAILRKIVEMFNGKIVRIEDLPTTCETSRLGGPHVAGSGYFAKEKKDADVSKGLDNDRNNNRNNR